MRVLIAYLGGGRDWLGLVGQSSTALTHPDLNPTDFTFVKGWGRTQIELLPDRFYRGNIKGLEIRFYVDHDGEPHCLPWNAFKRETERRYRQDIADVDLTADWEADFFINTNAHPATEAQ